MHLIDRYIFKQMLGSFVVVLAGLTALIWLTQSLKMVDMIVTKGVPAKWFFEMSFLVLPAFVQILSPLALFAVVLFVFSRMQADKELMVMRASGMGPGALLKPALVLGAILVGIGYLFSLILVPAAYSKLREMKWQIRNNLTHLVFQEGQFTKVQKGMTVYVKEQLSDGSVGGIIIHDTKDPDKVVTMVAKSGVFFQDGEAIQVLFHNGIRQEFNRKTQQFSSLKFDKYTMMFVDKSIPENRVSEVREQSLKTLLFAQDSAPEAAGRIRRYRVEAMKRLTGPLYNITFAILAALGVLYGHYNRRGQLKQVYAVVAGALFVQSFSLLFENMANRHLICLILMGINIIVPIGIAWVLLKFPFKKAKVVAALVCWFCLGIPQAHALEGPKVDINAPVDFESDHVEYDKNTDTLTAWGNVVVAQGPLVLKTQKIVYDRAADQILCPESTEVVDTEGNHMQVDNIRLSGTLKEGVARAIVMRLVDGSTITSALMNRKNEGTKTVFRDVSYTPCKFCETSSPLWALKSKKIIWNTTERMMAYQHSFLEVKGVPIFYLPYLSIPDFGVKRKTGLLAPSLVHSGALGTGIQTPFFVNVADNQNLVLTPVITLSHAPLGMVDYNGLFKRVGVHLQASGTKEEHGGNAVGHIKGGFEYDMTDAWRLKGNLFRVSEDTYFRRYRIPNIDKHQPFLTSDLTLERFGQRNYLSAKTLYFQSFQDVPRSATTPYVMPLVDYYYQTNTFKGTPLYAFTSINTASVQNRFRFNSNRLSVSEGLRLPYMTRQGIGMDIMATMRADGYHVDTGRYGFENLAARQKYDLGRISPNISALFNYPLAASSATYTQIFEPVVMLVYSDVSNTETKVPNVDSRDFDFDDTNLFSRNRFSGYDRVEKGGRINYGLKWSVYDQANRSISTLFGQSYQMNKDEVSAPLMGVEKHFSDYVGRVQIDYGFLTLGYRFRLDQEKLQVRKNEFTVDTGNDRLRLGMNYSYLKKVQTADYDYDTREEINVYGTAQLNKNWSLSARYRYDLLKNGGPLEWTGILRYDNECIAVMFDFDKSYAKDRNYSGDTSFMIKFVLKTLGGK